MRILGMMMIFISCSGIGIMCSYIYKKRLEEFIEWKKGVVMLKNEINYSLTPLSEAFEIISGRVEGSIQFLFKDIGAFLQTNHLASLEKMNDMIIEKSLYNSCFNQNDKKLIISFIKSLGLMDKDSQINNIKLHVEQVEHEIENIKNNEIKNNKLFRTLGVLSGIFVIVIFI